MTRTYKNLAVLFAFMAMLVYPFSVWGSIVIGMLAVVCGVYLVGDSRFAYRIIQPVLVLFSVIAVRGMFALIQAPFVGFASLSNNYYGSGFYNFNFVIDKVVASITALWLLVWGVISLVMMIMDKDVPLYDKLGGIVMGAVKKTEKTKPSKKSHDEEGIVNPQVDEVEVVEKENETDNDSEEN